MASPPAAAADAVTGAGAGAETGIVRVTLARGERGAGEVFLRGPRHRIYRLLWEETDRDLRRAIPAGRYAITGYRVARRDAKGTPWFISTTSHGWRTIVVRHGEETAVTIDPAIRIALRSRLHGGELRGAVGISGGPRLGLSIYRDGKRIAIPYRFLDAAGKAVAAGTLRYG